MDKTPLFSSSTSPSTVDTTSTRASSRYSGDFGPENASTYANMSSQGLHEASPREPHHHEARRMSMADMPQVIPERTGSRTLILCFDGTGDQYDQDNSNIVQFFQLLKKDDRSKQMVYYQAGIGTSSKHFVTPVAVALSKTVDVAIAHGLSDHVTDGYEFLMQNYTEGDRIAMFGFSRGAYTARALAGMLHKVGLLPACNHQQVPFAYHMYQRDDDEGWEMSNGFKQAFSIDVEINFMGLFDTVNSVGLIPKELPFAKSNYVVRTFRHAVALDERRAKFKANLWGRTTDEEAALAAPKREDYQSKKKREKLREQAATKRSNSYYAVEAVVGVVGGVSSVAGSMVGAVGSVGGYVAGTVGSAVGYLATSQDPEQAKPRRKWVPHGSGLALHSHSSAGSGTDAPITHQRPGHRSTGSGSQEVAHAIGCRHVELTETDVEEVWFSGAHTDVGGGSVRNGERYSLARISLRWMVRQCFKCNTGIMFHTNLLEDIGISPETLYPEVLPRPPPILSLDKIPAGLTPASLARPPVDPQLPPYTPLPTHGALPNTTSEPSTIDPLQSHQVRSRNPNTEATQWSHQVNSYQPYFPFNHHLGHELWNFGEGIKEPREPFINEEIEDLKDALSPIYDQLTLNWWWWILEFVPVKQVWRKRDNSWRRFFAINFGGPRVIENQKRDGVKVHRTVLIRMLAKRDIYGNPFAYSPRAFLKKAWVKWIGGSEHKDY